VGTVFVVIVAESVLTIDNGAAEIADITIFPVAAVVSPSTLEDVREKLFNVNVLPVIFSGIVPDTVIIIVDGAWNAIWEILTVIKFSTYTL